jgi:hypothetical protein
MGRRRGPRFTRALRDRETRYRMLLRAEPLAFVVDRGQTKGDMQVHPDRDRLTTILREGDKARAPGFSRE